MTPPKRSGALSIEDRRAMFRDAFGHKRPEKLSEYFDFERWPDKATMKVTRHEFAAVIAQMEKARRQNTWWSRLKRWLLARRGSGPVHAVEPPQAQPEQPEGAGDATAATEEGA